jgi:hypothetical protein
MWVILNDAWYSTDGTHWTAATTSTPWVLSPSREALMARDDHASVVCGNRMWVLGGDYGALLGQTNDVWYSTNGEIWTRATPHAGWSPRHGHSSVVFRGRMWVLGGKYTWNKGVDSATLDDIHYSIDTSMSAHWRLYR